MATILIVDDRPTDREVLFILLKYRGHRLLEATDGAEALALVRSTHPDLVIADILMPTMDGFEFVRQLREDATIADTRVMFYTAHYHDREANALASKCGVSGVITKPCNPEEVLSKVDVVLGITHVVSTPPTAALDREHFQVLNEKLSQKANDLRRTNERLTALIEHCLQLGSERAREPLLQGFCDAAREMIGARYTVMGLVSEEKGHHLITGGMDVQLLAQLTHPDPKQGVIQIVLGESRSLQLLNPDGNPVALGLPPTFPPIHSWLSVPVLSSSRVYGWMGLIDKIGVETFTDEDERLACLLAAQVGRVYENGHLYGVLHSHSARLEREITDRNRAEVALRQSEERFRGAFEHTNVAMVLTNAQHQFVRVNAAFTRLFGYTQSELLQMLLVDILHPDDLSESFARREALLAGESDFFQMEERYIHKTGHTIWGLTNVSIVRDTGSLSFLYVGQVQDITHRKHAEEALRAAQQRLESVVSSSPSVLFTLSYESFAPTWVSANIRDMTGFSVEETLRQNWWGEQIHPEDLRHVLDGNSDLLARGQIGREYRLKNRDGSYRWLREELRLISEVGGEPIEIVGSWLDITEHRNLQDQVRQVQKMEVVERLAGGVAHDFNNVLTVTMGYSELLASNLRQDDPLHKFTLEIRKAGHRGASLTRKLLAFSSKQVLVPAVLDPIILLREMETLLLHLIGENIALAVIAHPEIWTITVDRGQMEQAIVNLVVNTIDAMPQGGKLRIKISNVELNEVYTKTHSESRIGEYVSIAVEDTGTGMDEATQTRIFEPFFTTKSPDKGNGLGLAAVHGFIRQSGGHIDVSSKPGVGSTFKLYLPRSTGEIQPNKSASGIAEPRCGSETILLVEDEDGVRAFVRVVLERSGYTVLEADSGEAAINFCRHYPETIHAMVADMVMPNMSGWQLAERVILLRPEIKVLYLSGYNRDALPDQGILGADTPYLEKPFSPHALAAKVQEILQAK